MRVVALIVFLIANINSLCSQNLIPNGSFEQSTNLVHEAPPFDFEFLDFWYPANFFPNDPTYGGTPDLFNVNNLWPESSPSNFWNVAYGAAAGNFHAGIANFVTEQGYLRPEAIGTPLIAPLEANAYYHIELRTRNKGVANNFEREPIFCVSETHKYIDVLLDSDPIFVTLDADNLDSYVNTPQKVRFESPEIDSQIPGDWLRFGSCFQVNGGEQYLAVTLATGRFSVDAPCVIDEQSIYSFYIYYFDIDDLKLSKLPTSFSFRENICAGEQTKINIADLTNLPIMQNPIEYRWDDGRVDSINFITEAGTYTVDAVIDCHSIPITIEVTDAECEPSLFVPNAFSPNLDGINDQLQAFLSVDLPLINYQFSIYNRWGAIVYFTNDPNAGWDGRFQGKTAETGIYLWSVQYTLDDIEQGLVDYQQTGDVMLVR